jgi:hypothetical protein
MSALFLDPKNRRLLLRPIQPPDKMVMNVLRKFHGVMLESFEPSGDLVLLMRLVQAQQQFLCKFVKMILKALGTRPDAFSWVSQALLEIENVSSGRTFDKKIVPTLLEMYAASQGISLSSGQHALDTLVVNFPIDLTQADFEIFGNFAGEQLSILDGFEKCFSSVELGARNATAAFGLECQCDQGLVGRSVLADDGGGNGRAGPAQQTGQTKRREASRARRVDKVWA